MEKFQKKELKYSLKKTGYAMLLVLLLFAAATLLPELIIDHIDFGYPPAPDFLDDSDYTGSVFCVAAVIAVFFLVALYQRINNVLYYGNYGFSFDGVTYSFDKVTKLVAVHHGRKGTFYHLYVGDEIIYKFSTMYENKDDFIAVLQKNGVLIIA